MGSLRATISPAVRWRMNCYPTPPTAMLRRYYQQHQELIHEHLARFLATFLLVSMGWGALHLWYWVKSWLL